MRSAVNVVVVGQRDAHGPEQIGCGPRQATLVRVRRQEVLDHVHVHVEWRVLVRLARVRPAAIAIPADSSLTHIISTAGHAAGTVGRPPLRVGTGASSAIASSPFVLRNRHGRGELRLKRASVFPIKCISVLLNELSISVILIVCLTRAALGASGAITVDGPTTGEAQRAAHFAQKCVGIEADLAAQIARQLSASLARARVPHESAHALRRASHVKVRPGGDFGIARATRGSVHAAAGIRGGSHVTRAAPAAVASASVGACAASRLEVVRELLLIEV
mmetsp:Transcript_6464/g.26296  ORF Transcript_6464/g.26296 Transcript_6464/m.26296 type:complete len:277 (-) Transcript_6464:2154-2984(-)